VVQCPFSCQHPLWCGIAQVLQITTSPSGLMGVWQ